MDPRRHFRLFLLLRVHSLDPQQHLASGNSETAWFAPVGRFHLKCKGTVCDTVPFFICGPSASRSGR